MAHLAGGLDCTPALEQFEAWTSLRPHALDQQQIVLVVGCFGVALEREHTHRTIADDQRHGNGRLGQARGFCGVLHLDPRPFDGPVADQPRLPGPNHVADEAAAEWERADRQLGAVLHLVDDLDHLAGLVEQGDDEARRVQDVGQLLAQRTTQALDRPLVAKRQLDRAHDRQTRLAALTGVAGRHHVLRAQAGYLDPLASAAKGLWGNSAVTRERSPAPGSSQRPVAR